jgi:transcriptional regulator with XRE-family HTH domain
VANNTIRQHRERTGITREQLATLIGKSYSSILSYEQGTRDPGSVVWKKLSEIFDVSLDDLMGNERKGSVTTGASICDLERDWPEVAQVLRLNGEIPTAEERRRIARIIRATMKED